MLLMNFGQALVKIMWHLCLIKHGYSEQPSGKSERRIHQMADQNKDEAMK